MAIAPGTAWAVDRPAARAAGDFETAAVIAGEAAALIHDITSAAEVIERMVRTATELLLGGAELCTQDPRL